MHMMLSHMCEEPYWLLRKTFLAQLAVSFLLVVGIVPWVRVWLFERYVTCPRLTQRFLAVLCRAARALWWSSSSSSRWRLTCT
jgi:hypothetical protein